MTFIENQIANLRERERMAYIAGNRETADLMAELADSNAQDELGDAQRQIEELQAELNRADATVNYLRHRLALAEGF
jgi:hypothetical protein